MGPGISEDSVCKSTSVKEFKNILKPKLQSIHSFECFTNACAALRELKKELDI